MSYWKRPNVFKKRWGSYGSIRKQPYQQYYNNNYYNNNVYDEPENDGEYEDGELEQQEELPLFEFVNNLQEEGVEEEELISNEYQQSNIPFGVQPIPDEVNELDENLVFDEPDIGENMEHEIPVIDMIENGNNPNQNQEIPDYEEDNNPYETEEQLQMEAENSYNSQQEIEENSEGIIDYEMSKVVEQPEIVKNDKELLEKFSKAFKIPREKIMNKIEESNPEILTTYMKPTTEGIENVEAIEQKIVYVETEAEEIHETERVPLIEQNTHMKEEHLPYEEIEADENIPFSIEENITSVPEKEDNREEIYEYGYEGPWREKKQKIREEVISEPYLHRIPEIAKSENERQREKFKERNIKDKNTYREKVKEVAPQKSIEFKYPEIPEEIEELKMEEEILPYSETEAEEIEEIDRVPLIDQNIIMEENHLPYEESVMEPIEILNKVPLIEQNIEMIEEHLPYEEVEADENIPFETNTITTGDEKEKKHIFNDDEYEYYYVPDQYDERKNFGKIKEEQMISRELKEAEFNRAPEEDYEILHRVETKKIKIPEIQDIEYILPSHRSFAKKTRTTEIKRNEKKQTKENMKRDKTKKENKIEGAKARIDKNQIDLEVEVKKKLKQLELSNETKQHAKQLLEDYKKAIKESETNLVNKKEKNEELIRRKNELLNLLEIKNDEALERAPLYSTQSNIGKEPKIKTKGKKSNDKEKVKEKASEIHTELQERELKDYLKNLEETKKRLELELQQFQEQQRIREEERLQATILNNRFAEQQRLQKQQEEILIEQMKLEEIRNNLAIVEQFQREQELRMLQQQQLLQQQNQNSYNTRQFNSNEITEIIKKEEPQPEERANKLVEQEAKEFNSIVKETPKINIKPKTAEEERREKIRNQKDKEFAAEIKKKGLRIRQQQTMDDKSKKQIIPISNKPIIKDGKIISRPNPILESSLEYMKSLRGIKRKPKEEEVKRKPIQMVLERGEIILYEDGKRKSITPQEAAAYKLVNPNSTEKEEEKEFIQILNSTQDKQRILIPTNNTTNSSESKAFHVLNKEKIGIPMNNTTNSSESKPFHVLNKQEKAINKKKKESKDKMAYLETIKKENKTKKPSKKEQEKDPDLYQLAEKGQTKYGSESIKVHNIKHKIYENPNVLAIQLEEPEGTVIVSEDEINNVNILGVLTKTLSGDYTLDNDFSHFSEKELDDIRNYKNITTYTDDSGITFTTKSSNYTPEDYSMKISSENAVEKLKQQAKEKEERYNQILKKYSKDNETLTPDQLMERVVEDNKNIARKSKQRITDGFLKPKREQRKRINKKMSSTSFNTINTINTIKTEKAMDESIENLSNIWTIDEIHRKNEKEKKLQKETKPRIKKSSEKETTKQQKQTDYKIGQTEKKLTRQEINKKRIENLKRKKEIDTNVAFTSRNSELEETRRARIETDKARSIDGAPR